MLNRWNTEWGSNSWPKRAEASGFKSVVTSLLPFKYRELSVWKWISGSYWNTCQSSCNMFKSGIAGVRMSGNMYFCPYIYTYTNTCTHSCIFLSLGFSFFIRKKNNIYFDLFVLLFFPVFFSTSVPFALYPLTSLSLLLLCSSSASCMFFCLCMISTHHTVFQALSAPGTLCSLCAMCTVY